jgi:hypothetical protein
MTRGFLPNTDSGLLAFSLHLSSAISATPGDYGLTDSQAAVYAAAHAGFAAAMAACEPSLRTMGATAAKNAARDALKIQIRLVVSTINGQPAVTDAQKVSLGLAVPRAARVIPPPGFAPALSVVSAAGWTVKVGLLDASAGLRRRVPVDVYGASVFTFVGEQPPSDLRLWRFEGQTERARLEVEFDSANPPGTRVWLTAMWFNGRKQSGPMCPPVSANLPGGGVSVAA